MSKNTGLKVVFLLIGILICTSLMQTAFAAWNTPNWNATKLQPSVLDAPNWNATNLQAPVLDAPNWDPTTGNSTISNITTYNLTMSNTTKANTPDSSIPSDFTDFSTFPNIGDPFIFS
jgi:hypothetical protein